MFRCMMFAFAMCFLFLCTFSLAEENKDSGKTGAHRLNWGGAAASAGYPAYPGVHAGVGEYPPYAGVYPPVPAAYPPVPAAYPPVAYPGSYYPPSPWAFKTNEGKKLPE